MAERLSTGLCNKLLDTNSLKAIFSGTTGEIRLYQGTVPTSADAACPTPTPVCVIKEGGAAINFAASASGGSIAKSAAAWTGVNAATATVTYYRVCLAADANDLSALSPRIQGTIGTTGSEDMVLGTAALVNAATFTLNYFTQSIVPS